MAPKQSKRQRYKRKHGRARGKKTHAWKLLQFDFQKGICPLCNFALVRDVKFLDRDHIIPVSRGGTNELSNLHVVHPRCNNIKGARLEEELDENFIDMVYRTIPTLGKKKRLLNRMVCAIMHWRGLCKPQQPFDPDTYNRIKDEVFSNPEKARNEFLLFHHLRQINKEGWLNNES